MDHLTTYTPPVIKKYYINCVEARNNTVFIENKSDKLLDIGVENKLDILLDS